MLDNVQRAWQRALAAGLILSASATIAVVAPAQTAPQAGRAGIYTRADLEAAAVVAEREAGSDAGKRAEAAALRARLKTGDFSPGDRIVVEIRGEPPVFDTVVVRTGPTMRLAGMPDVPLQGVLRSELQDYLSKYVSRYIRDPDVRTESLIRLSVLGQVGRPGFYDFNSDVPLTDAIMAAGGPTGDAAIERSTIRRGTSVVLQKESVRRAAQSGATLDRLGLRPGDEITIGQKRERLNLQTLLGITGAVASLALTILFFARN